MVDFSDPRNIPSLGHEVVVIEEHRHLYGDGYINFDKTSIVVDLQSQEPLHEQMKNMQEQSDWVVSVYFPSGHTKTVKARHLIKVDKPPVELTRYEVDGRRRPVTTPGRGNATLDTYKIKEGRSVFKKYTMKPEAVEEVIKIMLDEME